MSHKTRKTIATLAAVLAVAAVVPATSAANQDLRSPDTRDAVVLSGQDLRSPDAQDVARPTSAAPATAPGDSGTDWGEIGMIAGAIVLALGGVGAVVYLTRRRGHGRKSGATVASS
jgi:hypothetical protein